MCRDALDREESCGCHLREEHQTEDGEAVRDDKHHANVQVWDWQGEGAEPDDADRGARLRVRGAA